jgi:rhodanese-related sulfurtransferase
MGFFNKLFGSGVDLKEKLNQGAIILDVRSKGEYKGGNVKGSINIPLDALDSRIKEIKLKDKPVITCCASGMRSGVAKNKLKANGVEAYNGGSWMKVQNL